MDGFLEFFSKEMFVNISTCQKAHFTIRCEVIKSGNGAEVKPKFDRFENTFSEDMEAYLMSHLTELDNNFLPLSRKDFLKVAHDLAEEMHIDSMMETNPQENILLLVYEQSSSVIHANC
jgi:hypothetical protein